METRLAIDFGTTNTAAAYSAQNRVQQVRLSSAGDQMPSGVLVRDDAILVGETAHNESHVYPEVYEPNPKRRIGESRVLLGTHSLEPAELVRHVVEYVRTEASHSSGVAEEHLTSVCLTHPVQWRQHQRDQLEDGARRAGFTKIELIPEPVAAASNFMASEARSIEVPDASPIAVFDFGGGTCDVAVLQPTIANDGRTFQVLAHDGLPDLGGEEIDRVVMKWALFEAMQAEYHVVASGLRDPETLADWFILRDGVRKAKHTLSKLDHAGISVKMAGSAERLTLQRSVFEELIESHVAAAASLTTQVFEQAGIGPDDLATLPDGRCALYMTGGSSLVPAVQQRLEDVTGRPPARLDDPKTVVAKGALQVSGGVELLVAGGPQAGSTPHTHAEAPAEASLFHYEVLVRQLLNLVAAKDPEAEELKQLVDDWFEQGSPPPTPKPKTPTPKPPVPRRDPAPTSGPRGEQPDAPVRGGPAGPAHKPPRPDPSSPSTPWGLVALVAFLAIVTIAFTGQTVDYLNRYSMDGSEGDLYRALGYGSVAALSGWATIVAANNRRRSKQ